MVRKPFNFAIAAAIALSTAACAPVAASSNGRMIQHVNGIGKADAFEKADRQCNRYGRAAIVDAYGGGAMAFHCVEP